MNFVGSLDEPETHNPEAETTLGRDQSANGSKVLVGPQASDAVAELQSLSFEPIHEN